MSVILLSLKFMIKSKIKECMWVMLVFSDFKTFLHDSPVF